MASTTTIPCAHCGAPLILDVGEFMPEGKLDLTLECSNCEAPTLNAFVPFADFEALE
ncbi:hypothetical protein PJWF_00075 [Achromobacter phage JWF]|uniref:hypothetical protein n=1 Tax=Achromobacter phage JWF TaxID=1589748 RepID=UPI000588E774|nr:hypothetical protein AXJ13_gp113 [Achromobacter phage JWF]AJD82968.1 hypothetical protein PJWF_00075 [Achromobacter phage JWF]